ncbi:MAG TPA: ribonuclease R, partial [Devosia sp.]|nr:ribonuclease R [Devosia sp.]
MNKKTQDQHQPSLPSKEQVLEALEQHSELRTKRDLTRYFAIKGDLRSPFKKLIRTLEDDGVLARKGKTMRRARELPRVTVLDILSDCDPDDLVAHPANWAENEGKPPLVRIEVKRNDRTIPGPGDRILARIFKNTDQRDSYS